MYQIILNNLWSEGLFLFLGSIFLVFRMLSSKGKQSPVVKILLGISVFSLLNAPYILGTGYPFAFGRGYTYEWGSRMLFHFTKPSFVILLVVYGLLILLGIITLIYLGVTAEKEPEVFDDQIDERFLPRDQYGRFEYIMVNIKWLLIGTAVCLVFLLLAFILRKAGYQYREMFGELVVVIFVIALIILVIAHFYFIVKRLRNMGKSPSLYIGGYLVGLFCLSLIATFMLHSGIPLIAATGIKLNMLVILSGYLAILYLACSPTAANSLKTSTE